jgi:hypothetical protein
VILEVSYGKLGDRTSLKYLIKTKLASPITWRITLDVALSDIRTIIKFGEKYEFAALSKLFKAVDGNEIMRMWI